MTVVEELLALSQPRLVAFVLALARVAGLFLIAPVLASRATPLRVRAALVFFLTVTMLPLLARTAAPAAAMTGPLALLGSMLLETSLGFAIGMVAQLIMGAVQMAGQLVGIQMGIGLANLIDPHTQEHITSLAQWQHLVALLVYLAVDGHHVLIGAVAESFAVVPLGRGFPAPAGFEVLFALAGGVFVVALRIAAPVMVLLLLVNGAMGVLARMIPQLNVFIVGFPLNVASGLFMLAAAQPFAVRFLAGTFAGMGASLAALMRALG